MASAIMLPFYALCDLVEVAADVGDYGTSVTTHELGRALDTARNTYTYLWCGGDQPVIWQYAAPDFEWTSQVFNNCKCGFYVRLQKTAFDPFTSYDPDGINYLEWQMSSAGSSWVKNAVGYQYGDGSTGTVSSNTVDLLGGGSGEVTGVDGQTILLMDMAMFHTFVYHMLFFGTASGETPVTPTTNGNFKFWDLLHGVFVDLPDKLSVEKSWPQDWSGGEVGFKPFAQVSPRGISTEGSRRRFTARFVALTTTELNLIHELFRYGRGCIPVLWCEDTSDKTTWRKVIMRHAARREPSEGSWDFDVDMEEC